VRWDMREMFQISAHSLGIRKQFETQLHASLYSSGQERALRVVYPFPLRKVRLECLVNMLFAGRYANAEHNILQNVQESM
jgi:hypothetical protein